jgi:hypothetical protein
MPAVASRAPNEMIPSCSINSMFRNKEDVLSLKMQSIVIMLIAHVYQVSCREHIVIIRMLILQNKVCLERTFVSTLATFLLSNTFEMIPSCSINSMFRNKEDVLSLKMQSIVIMLIASIALEHIEHGTRNIRMYTETSV